MDKEILLRDEVELIDGTKTNKIKMREPTRADMKFGVQFKDEVEAEDKMIIRLSGISQEALDAMPLCDSNKIRIALEEMGATDYNPKN